MYDVICTVAVQQTYKILALKFNHFTLAVHLPLCSDIRAILGDTIYNRASSTYAFRQKSSGTRARVNGPVNGASKPQLHWRYCTEVDERN